ncbi:carbohydrate kinase family protein [Actinoplanes sp. NPDC000266]
MTEFDVLVVGDANPDLLLRGDVRPRFGQEEQLLTAAELVLGGSAAITAVGCAKLGLRTALLAAVGDDMFGTLVREQLTGVHLVSPEAAGRPTGLTVILSEPDDRAMLTLPGTISALRPEHVTAELLVRARHVHVASLYLQPELAKGLAGVFERAHGLGRTTSLDTNFDPSGEWAAIEDILEHTDYFLPNAAELLAVTGAARRRKAAGPEVGATRGEASRQGNAAGVEMVATPGEVAAVDRGAALEEAAAALVQGGTTVVMKDGARGARSWWSGGECAAPGKAVEVVDATGAGDSFNAGFLAARLDGRDMAEAVRWAAVAGSLSTRAAGGTAAQATRQDLV